MRLWEALGNLWGDFGRLLGATVRPSARPTDRPTDYIKYLRRLTPDHPALLADII